MALLTWHLTDHWLVVVCVHTTRAQEDVEVQRKGFTVLVDGTGSKYSNFDPKMPRVLLDGIISRYPGTTSPPPCFCSSVSCVV